MTKLVPLKYASDSQNISCAEHQYQSAMGESAVMEAEIFGIEKIACNHRKLAKLGCGEPRREVSAKKIDLWMDLACPIKALRNCL